MSTNDICDICRVQLRDDEFGMFCENCLYEDPEQPVNREIIEKYPPIKIESYIDTGSQCIIFQNTYLRKILFYAIQQINLHPNSDNCLDTKDDNDDIEKQSEKLTNDEEESGEDDKC
jgi:hypothetical protein